MLDCLHIHVIFSSRMGSKNFEDRGGARVQISRLGNSAFIFDGG